MLKGDLRQMALVIPVAFGTGLIIAFFLWLLDAAIAFQIANSWAIFLLPLAGVVIHLIYRSIGKSSEQGNNLIIEEIHNPKSGVPLLMAPVILFTTVLTHLFGGSAGREGTAVQIGGGIAGMFSRTFKLGSAECRLVLIAGVSAGFGAVFGTPFAGAIFGVEMLTVRKIKFDAFLPALVASTVADLTVSAIGIHHTQYQIADIMSQTYFLSHYLPFDLTVVGKAAIAAILFGFASWLFSNLIHQVKHVMHKLIQAQWLIPVMGGLIIILLTLLNGKTDYLGLGISPPYPEAVTIPSAFTNGGADNFSWLWKTVYTAITLGTGFKGGEVTPLFYIGATLGNSLAMLLNAPVGLFAALGFIAVFSGATKTPLASTIMGAELFGGHYILLFGLVCYVAAYCSGEKGIYGAQRLSLPEAL
ncbi:MAG: voltage-gated chloride channel protein [Chryseobacterium sp.]|nr:MAG: voltage-gated chloride channel protein [Chryseobacterium sp.]